MFSYQPSVPGLPSIVDFSGSGGSNGCARKDRAACPWIVVRERRKVRVERMKVKGGSLEIRGER